LPEEHERMPSRSEISRLSWTLIDQAVVSVGSFSVNIALARLLPQPDYGIFAAILASLLLLQIVNVTLVLYPATLYVASPKRDDRQDVIAAALLLLTSTTLPLACLLVAILLALGEV
jgi:O-antigen/teichoic acid export membrane protein